MKKKFFASLSSVDISTLNGVLEHLLQQESDAEYAVFSAKLVPGLSLPMRGVRLPVLREMAKAMAQREDWREVYALLLQPSTIEEQMLTGLLLGYACRDYGEFERLVQQFLPHITNWSVCDCCCSSFAVVRKYREEAWPFLSGMLSRPGEFEQRFGIIMLMDHYRIPEFLPRIMAAYSPVSPAGYYAEMGLAWALSVFFLDNPQVVYALLGQGVWPKTVCRMACQKILESRRTPSGWREPVRLLRERQKN